MLINADAKLINAYAKSINAHTKSINADAKLINAYAKSINAYTKSINAYTKSGWCACSINAKAKLIDAYTKSVNADAKLTQFSHGSRSTAWAIQNIPDSSPILIWKLSSARPVAGTRPVAQRSHRQFARGDRFGNEETR